MKTTKLIILLTIASLLLISSCSEPTEHSEPIIIEEVDIEDTIDKTKKAIEEEQEIEETPNNQSSDDQINLIWVSEIPEQCTEDAMYPFWDLFQENTSFPTTVSLYGKEFLIYDAKRIQRTTDDGRPVVVCAACGCPSGSEIFFEIDENDLEILINIGYESSTGPN
tara:strand:+ start:732 stop:1229 length:498 start_codon:yes stop_codon:yes gene_type:complete